MTLADSSVWVDHLRYGNSRLAQQLEEGEIVAHPFVVGEIACGNLAQRADVLRLLKSLPSVAIARHQDVLDLVSARRLYGKGLGWIDVHLLASAISSATQIWTIDKRLARVAQALGVAA